VIAEKQSKTATRRRSLKNADWEADFFFMGWEFGGVLIFAEAFSGAINASFVFRGL
jgi:hypothetical protein